MGVLVDVAFSYHQGSSPPVALQDWSASVLPPRCKLPDATTMAKDVKNLYGWSERHLAVELQVGILITHPERD